MLFSQRKKQIGVTAKEVFVYSFSCKICWPNAAPFAVRYQNSASVRLRTSSALRRRILRKLSDKSERIVARHEMAGGVFESDACLVYSFGAPSFDQERPSSIF